MEKNGEAATDHFPREPAGSLVAHKKIEFELIFLFHFAQTIFDWGFDPMADMARMITPTTTK